MNKLYEKAEATFLWVALACKELGEVPLWRTVTITYRPLRLQELAATNYWISISSLSQFVDRCGSFLTVREGIVYFIH